MMPTFPANNYRVALFGAQGTNRSFIGHIQLLNSSTPRGYINFLNIPDDQALPPDGLGGGDSYVIMHQRAKFLDAFLTVVKGPKPLFISFDPSGLSGLLSPISATLTSEQSSDAEASVLGEPSPDTQWLQVLQDLMAKEK
jgi:hypothetical protein